MPKVTIICLTYNHEAFIRECLDGFVKQKTTFPFEAIIIDDASTDATASIVHEYALEYPEIIKPVYQQQHRHLEGLRDLMEMLLQSVKSQYVAFCDGDDYWTDLYKLQKQVDFLDAHLEYVVCYHDAAIVDAQGQRRAKTKLPAKYKKDFSADELMFAPVILKLTICFRHLLSEVPPEFYQVFNTDIFLIALLGRYGKGKYMGETILPAMYREHPNSMWSSLAKDEQELRNLNSRLCIYQYYWRCGDHDIALKFLYEKIFLHILAMKNNPYKKAHQFLKKREQAVRLKEQELQSIKKLWKILVGLLCHKIHSFYKINK